MINLSVNEILEATGGRLLCGKPNGVAGVSIDSRSIGEGELFIALKGQRFDGHDFLYQAMNRAGGAIVSRPPADMPQGKVIIAVDNTLRALQAMARFMRRKYEPCVIGITGTNGKTTTKEMTSSILGARMTVLKNTGNLNNHIGLPLSIMKLGPEHRAVVLEMGASAAGDIAELCGIAEPDYGVLTNIGMAHIEGFGDIDVVRKTKTELLESVKAVAVNADDIFLMEGLTSYAGRVVKYGLGEGVDVRAVDVELGARDSAFTLVAGGRSMRVRLGVTGMFNVYNALAAASAATLCGLGAMEASEALEGFKGVPMRLEISDLGGATVISDLYNANPASMEEALKELVRQRGERAVAVLGDMLELGAYAETAHRKVGAWMAGARIDMFIAVGPMMAEAAAEFTRLSGKAAFTFEDSAAAKAALLREVRHGDTVLVKGSRGMRMERVLEQSESGSGS